MLVTTPRDWGNIVRDRRAELGLTQEELAERIGRARQWVVRFESGHAGSASLESLTRVLDALGLYATVGEAVDDEGLDSLMPGPDSLDVFER
ncbi:helix-turn-helix domain-containing protein [Salana multivorans]